jgi:hypothetical protein
MAYETREGSNVLTIVIAAIVVLLIAMALYYGFTRGQNGVGGPDEGTETEFNGFINPTTTPNNTTPAPANRGNTTPVDSSYEPASTLEFEFEPTAS